MQFNMFNWLLETVSLILVYFSASMFITILYLLITSCGTPLVYYLGIEENRQLVREWIVSKLRSLARSGTAVTCTTTATSASATVSVVAGPSSRHAASTPPTPPPRPSQAGQPVPNICESVPHILPGVVM